MNDLAKYNGSHSTHSPLSTSCVELEPYCKPQSSRNACDVQTWIYMPLIPSRCFQKNDHLQNILISQALGFLAFWKQGIVQPLFIIVKKSHRSCRNGRGNHENRSLERLSAPARGKKKNISTLGAFFRILTRCHGERKCPPFVACAAERDVLLFVYFCLIVRTIEQTSTQD